MGPRLFSVEYRQQPPPSTPRRVALQWGHAYSAWNTGVPMLWAGALDGLQWGHAYSAWNTAGENGVFAVKIRFNGATLIQRGIRQQTRLERNTYRCFNGATLIQRGIQFPEELDTPEFRGFNGATLIQRGIQSGVSRRTAARAKLQWGHAYSAWNTESRPPSI